MDDWIGNELSDVECMQKIKETFEILNKWNIDENGEELDFEDYFYSICEEIKKNNREDIMNRLFEPFKNDTKVANAYLRFVCECDKYLKLTHNNNEQVKSKIRKSCDTAINKGKKQKKAGDDSDSHKGSSVPGAAEKRKYEEKMIEDISRVNCLKGNQNALFLNYKQVKEQGFYDVQIGDGRGATSSEEFINREWEEKGTGYQCIVISGDLGAGKSILSCRVAEKILTRKRSNRTIIFISAKNQSEELIKISKKFLNYFCQRKWTKRGKFVVIIDGWDELLESQIIKNSKRIFEAAKYYNATLMISSRTSALDKIQKIENSVDQSLKTKKLSKNTQQEARRGAKLFEKISSEVLSETRSSPLFRKQIEMMAEQELESSEGNVFFENDYMYVGELFRTISEREDEKYDSYRKNKENVENWLKAIAINLYVHDNAPVTLASCVPNEEKKDMYMKLAEISFFKEMVIVENFMGELIVKGFKYLSFFKFFLMKLLCEKLQGDKDELLLFLQLKWETDEFENMKVGMLESIPADKKEGIKKSLTDILNTNGDMKLEVENILNAL